MEHQVSDLHISTSAKESELEKENQELRQQLIDAQSKIIRLMEGGLTIIARID